MPNLDLPPTPDWFVSDVTDARRFVLPPDQLRREAVLSGGVETCGGAYGVDRASFPSIGIEFVASGNVHVELDGRPAQTVGPGGLFAYGPRIAHRLHIARSAPAVKYFVDLRGPAFRRQLTEIGLTPGAIGETALPHRVLALFEELITAGIASADHAGFICNALLSALLHTLADSYSPLTSAESTRDRGAFVTYQRLRRTLENDALELRTLSDVAEVCGISTSYACRLFQRFDSDSPHRRLLRVRMSHAAGLLRGNAPVVQVAWALGYDDPAHFSRAFKQIFGVPPSTIRRHVGASDTTKPS